MASSPQDVRAGPKVEKEAMDVVPLVESMFKTQGAEFKRGRKSEIEVG
jgi:hypothetical protein